MKLNIFNFTGIEKSGLLVVKMTILLDFCGLIMYNYSKSKQ